jgi:8-oxo-dGTP diphosphatase
MDEEPCGIESILPPVPLIYVASAALIDADDRILVQQRPSSKTMAGLWEFPGGKCQPEESPEQCLVRELQEELAITTWPSCLAPFTFTSYRYDTFHLVMFLFLCRKWNNIVQPQEGQVLKWITARTLHTVQMPAANASLIAMIRDFL